MLRDARTQWARRATGCAALALALACSQSAEEIAARADAGQEAGAGSSLGEASLAMGAEPRAPRLVLLYAPCTVAKNHLAPYEASVAYTPQLAAFARDAVVFRRHQTEAGQSGIAYASIFSGAQADRHGAFRHPLELSDELYLLAEAFADQGYETFFWNGHEMGGPNYDQGVAPANHFEQGLAAGDPRFAAILDELSADPSYKALVTTNFFVTHSPYRMGVIPSFRKRHPGEADGLRPDTLRRLGRLYHDNHIALAFDYPATVERLGLSMDDRSQLVGLLELAYKANVEALDQHFGAVLGAIDARGLRDEALVAFTADHGELLRQEDELFQWSHAMQITPEVLGVPLLVRSPDPRVRPGPYEAVTRSIDVLPTLAGLAGFALPEDRGIQGKDLSPALRGESEAPELVAASHTTLLVRSVYERMHDPRHAHNWGLVQRYFPDEAAEHMWVALREGDRLTRWRKRADGEWSFEGMDLSPGSRRFWEPLDPADPQHAESIEGLREYKGRLLAAHAGAAESLLPATDELEALQGLGYIE